MSVDILESGSKYYFTGMPCKNGHVSKRYVANGECWECRQEWRKRNRQKTNARQAVNRHKWLSESHKNVIKEKECNSISKIAKFNTENGTSYASYSFWKDRLPPTDEPKWKRNDVLTVKCFRCGSHFAPDRQSVNRRSLAVKGKRHGESNFYCSDSCRKSCPIYGFATGPRRHDPRSNRFNSGSAAKARSCQTNHLKQIQCDDVGYNYCERCGDIIDVELHHTQAVSKAGKDAISSAGHLLLCAGCHLLLHEKC
jgi:hypothetical protein